ncbi:MAG: DUF4214 domain-containing protein, partial [Pirellulales bacterium]
MSLSSILDRLAAQRPLTRRKKRLRPIRCFVQSLEPRTLLTSDSALPSLSNAADSPSGPSDDQKFVNQAYHDLLGRPADAGGLAYWVAQLSSGAPQGAIANAFAHSDEYYSTIIKPAYQNYLGRTADSGGLDYWISQMQSGLTDEHLEANFIGSPEFYAHAGGADKLWVDAMYTSLLARPADPQGESYWVGQLAAGVSRETVAYGFADSLERESQRVQGDYEHYLNRSADADGLSYWVGQFAHGLTNEDLIAGFVGSPEYFAHAANSTLALSAHLTDDTGVSNTDGITSDPTVAGKIADTTYVTSLLAGFDVAAADGYVNVLANLKSDDSFSFSAAQLATIFRPGAPGLADGSHTLHL